MRHKSHRPNPIVAELSREAGPFADVDRAVMNASLPFAPPKPKRHHRRHATTPDAAEKIAHGKPGLARSGLENLIRVRHGGRVSHLDYPVYLEVAAHLFALARAPYRRFAAWAAKWTDGYHPDDLADIYDVAIAEPKAFTGDELAVVFGISEAFRRYCEERGRPLRMFGSVDSNAASREKARAVRKKERREADRRASGAPDRKTWCSANTKYAGRRVLAAELGVSVIAVRKAEKRGPEAYAAFVEKHRRKMAARRVDVVVSGVVLDIRNTDVRRLFRVA